MAPSDTARTDAEPGRNLTFSVVTPSWNQARFIGDAIASVRGQRHVACEHVVVDGESSDGTDMILRRAGGDVRFLIEPDDGQSDALNKGLQLARGEILGWLNADDFYLPGTLQAVEACFLVNPDADVVYGDCVFVDESGCVLRGLEQHGFDARVLLYYGTYIPSTASFFRSRLASEGLLRFDTTLHQVMDLELFLRLATAGVRFHYLARDLAAFRWHGHNKSLDRESARTETLRVQSQYGAITQNPVALDVLGRVFALKHLWMKVISGASRRQFGWSQRRGLCLKWWPENADE